MIPIVKPSPAEQLTKLIEEGRFADYSSSTADCPANGAEWGEERTIRGYFVFSLAVGINSSVNGKGIWIRGAKIIDGLDFRGCEIPHTVWLENCYIEGGIDLSDVSIHSMILTGCYIGGTAKDRGNLHGIIANRLHCRGSLLLNNGFTVNSEAQLSDAHIGGVLQCAGGKFHNGLSAIRLTIEGSVSLADTFYVKGGADCSGAKIGRDLDCTGGTFESPSELADHSANASKPRRPALNAEGLNIVGDILLREDFKLMARFGYAESRWAVT